MRDREGRVPTFERGLTQLDDLSIGRRHLPGGSWRPLAVASRWEEPPSSKALREPTAQLSRLSAKRVDFIDRLLNGFPAILHLRFDRGLWRPQSSRSSTSSRVGRAGLGQPHIRTTHAPLRSTKPQIMATPSQSQAGKGKAIKTTVVKKVVKKPAPAPVAAPRKSTGGKSPRKAPSGPRKSGGGGVKSRRESLSTR